MLNKAELKQEMIEKIEEAIYGLGYKDLFNPEQVKQVKKLIYQAQCEID